jgi:glucose-6-phosphate isomerase
MTMNLSLPGKPYQTMLEAGSKALQDRHVLSRIWDRDHTVWKPDPDEITNRLGWLDTASRMTGEIPRIKSLAREVRQDGIRAVFLLGMGGSSLAPELFSRTFPADDLSLEILDSTHPEAVQAVRDRLEPERTLFIVASKSGSTVETLSLYKTFYRLMAEAPQVAQPGRHFVAITDPGSRLVDLADRYGFREVFLNDPEIGGRYSVLSFFGLVPAGLLDMDLEALLSSAQAAAERCQIDPGEGFNPGLELGSALGVFAVNGRDKLTFFSSPELASFQDWVEQLLAESTGKSGRGILPVVGTAPGDPEVYGPDRVFVHLTLEGGRTWDQQVQALREAGFPVIELSLGSRYQLGGQFFLWEMAAAVSGVHLEINPFNQPNVESAKRRAREMMDRYRETGTLGDAEGEPPDSTRLDQFVQDHRTPDSYLAVQAYLAPRTEIRSALARLQRALRDRYQLAVTVGFGPRYLHSTGQLHKGDGGAGIFLQLLDSPEQDTPIPDRAEADTSEISFGNLIRAQALGDARALREADRPVLQFQLGRDPLSGVNRLA